MSQKTPMIHPSTPTVRRIVELEKECARLAQALERLMNSDPEITECSEDALCEAANDANADAVVREQAAAILQARAALAKEAK